MAERKIISPSNAAANPWVSYVGAAVFFRLVLDACYVYYLNAAFSDHFLTPMELRFDFIQYLGSYAFLIAAVSFVPKGKKNFSGLFFFSALAFLYIPMTSMYGLNSEKNALAPLVALIALFSAHLSANIYRPRLAVPIARNGEKKALYISFFFIFVFLIWSVLSGAVANINFDLAEIYENRELSGGQLDVGLMAYINLWTEKVLNPFLLAVGLHRKKKALIIFAVGMQIYFFAVTQHRVHLFVPILIYLIFLLYQGKFEISRLYLIAGAALGLFLVFSLSFGFDDAAAIVVRRAFFVPSSVTFDWINFFSNAEKSYWSDGFFSGLISTPYSGRLLPYYLGDYFVPGKSLAFNAGIVGTGYAQAGFLGVIFYATTLGFFLRFVNGLIKGGLPVYMVAAVLITPIRTAWADSDLFSALLSHGILIGIVVLWLYGKSKEKDRAKPRTIYISGKS